MSILKNRLDAEGSQLDADTLLQECGESGRLRSREEVIYGAMAHQYGRLREIVQAAGEILGAAQGGRMVWWIELGLKLLLGLLGLHEVNTAFNLRWRLLAEAA